MGTKSSVEIQYLRTCDDYGPEPPIETQCLFVAEIAAGAETKVHALSTESLPWFCHIHSLLLTGETWKQDMIANKVTTIYDVIY